MDSKAIQRLIKASNALLEDASKVGLAICILYVPKPLKSSEMLFIFLNNI
jgi:hypothetical protein